MVSETTRTKSGSSDYITMHCLTIVSVMLSMTMVLCIEIVSIYYEELEITYVYLLIIE
jgi:hypothetical protein